MCCCFEKERMKTDRRHNYRHRYDTSSKLCVVALLILVVRMTWITSCCSCFLLLHDHDTSQSKDRVFLMKNKILTHSFILWHFFIFRHFCTCNELSGNGRYLLVNFSTRRCINISQCSLSCERVKSVDL